MRIANTNNAGIQKMISQIVTAVKANEPAARDQQPEPKAADTMINDTLDISDGAKQRVNDLQSSLEEMRAKAQQVREDIKRAGEAGDGMAAAMREKLICLKIAMRIMSGDIVPEADHRFLAEKDPDLYHQAISMRVEKVDPEEHDRLSEDEEDDDAAAMSDAVNSRAEAVLASVQSAVAAAAPPEA